jgi:hypothetical protein
MMEAARISETSVDNYFTRTRQYIPEGNSELQNEFTFQAAANFRRIFGPKTDEMTGGW